MQVLGGHAAEPAQTVLWSIPSTAAACRVESASRMVSAYAGHVARSRVPAIAVWVRSLNVRRQSRQR